MKEYLKSLLDRQTPGTRPEDVEQLQYAAALVESYQGNMGAAIEHWEECYRIVQATCLIRYDDPGSTGDAYSTRRRLDNGAYRAPGDKCIFPAAGGLYPAYKKTEDVLKPSSIPEVPGKQAGRPRSEMILTLVI